MAKKILVGQLVLLVVLLSVIIVFLLKTSYVEEITINLKVNGNDINDETKAINFKGNTMIPLNLINNSLGAEVKWDNKSKTAEIKTSDSLNSTSSEINKNKLIVSSANQANQNQDQPKPTSQDLQKKLNNLQKNINNIKFDSKVSAQYYHLYDLGMQINSLSNDLLKATKKENAIDLYEIQNKLDKITKEYNSEKKITSELILQAKNLQIDLADMETILKKYEESLNNYKAATQDLYYFHKLGYEEEFNNFSSHLQKANDLILEGSKIASNGFMENHEKIQQY